MYAGTTGAPERGALAFFDKNADGLADHVGIVTAVSDDGFQTIEGNLGKAVVSQTHSYADGEVLGYGLLLNASEEPETPEETADSSLTDEETPQAAPAEDTTPEEIPLTDPARMTANEDENPM